MENLAPLIAQLWTVLTARAQALSDIWKGFHDFPKILPRKIHASVSRDLAKLESLLRRKLLYDAHQLSAAMTPEPPKPKRVLSNKQGARSKGSTAAEPRAPSILPFRFDEGSARAGRPFHRPRILSFDAIMAMPTRMKTPRPETLDTTRLFRRLESFYVAIGETDILARKLAQRLANNDLPRLKMFKAGKTYKPWAGVFAKIDLILAGFDLPNPAFDNFDTS